MPVQVEFGHLQKITELVSYHWETACVVCLKDGPLRYSQLRPAMKEWMGRQLGDGVFSRTLAELAKKGIIHRVPVERRRRGWALTPAGVTYLAQLEAVVNALEYAGDQGRIP